jgi:hypothetical protein
MDFDDTPATLDETDLELIAILQNEFVFTGAATYESELMSHALRAEPSLRNAIETLTGQMRSHLKFDALILGLSPEVLGNHHVLVLPDYRFGASSRVHGERHYILFNAGCMHLFSYLAEISILFGRVTKLPATLAGKELEAWLMDDALALALAFLQRPFALPHLRRYFDDDMNLAEASVLASVELFVYFHEAGHIELGHLGSGFGDSEQGRTLPDGAEEFAADRFAMAKILSAPIHSSRPGHPVGAFILEELFYLELHGYRQQAGAVSYRDRLGALIRNFPDNFLHDELPGPAPDTVLPWDRTGFDVCKATLQLAWTCDQVAQMLGIDVPDELAARPSERSKGVDLIYKSVAQHAGTDLTPTMLALFKAGGDLDALRAFVCEHPAVLSDDADTWLDLAIVTEEALGAKALLGAMRVYLRRCREAGVEDVLPIKFAWQALMKASSLDEKFDILRAQPHLLSDESLDYTKMHGDESMTRGDTGLAGELHAISTMINQSRELGIDACLELIRSLPLLPFDVWQLIHALDTATHNGDVMEQIRICNEGVALADKEEGVPTWSLPFRERLQHLPQF